jgi:NADH-quinone oxidoreductase subunit G
MPKLKINNIEVEVAAGTSILQAAEMIGVEIPRFCYHDRMSVPANCRMCLVEVKGAPKPVASCALACGDNMEVFTDSAMSKKARRGVMEMLLINHPLDCPICDQGGECDLQDQAMAFGFDRSRYFESKRAVKDKDIGPLVKTVMTRCIQCTRCVRFTDEIAGTSELGLMNRGENVEIGPFVDKYVTTELSGNLVDVCPVGALTNKPYAFKARSWELRKTESVDVHDAVGSNIRLDARGNEVLRVLPRLNEDVNEEWISDRTRYAVDGLSNQRLDQPYVRDPRFNRLRAVTWEEAMNVAAEGLKKAGGTNTAALAGDLCAVEDMVALKDLMAALGSTNHDCRVDGAALDPRVRAGYLFNTGIAGLEQADAILIVGANPRWDATMVNARIRKSWLQSNKRLPIATIGENIDLTYPTMHLSKGPDALQALKDGKGPFAEIFKNAKNPVMIVGMAALQRVDGLSVLKLCREVAEKYKLNRDDWNGFNILHTAASRVGAFDIGFVANFDFAQMKAVYLLNVDTDIVNHIRPDTFVIYQGHHGDKGAARADVIFPAAAYTEKNGLYVNMEGRVQQGRQAIHPLGQAREDWKIIRALSEVMDRPLPYDTAAQLHERVIKEWPHMARVGEIAKAEGWGEFGVAGTIANTAFGSFTHNYYKTNVICNASKTMTDCVQSFLAPITAEAAE